MEYKRNKNHFNEISGEDQVPAHPGLVGVFRVIVISLLALLVGGCTSHVTLDRSSPLSINPEDYQPVALLPIADASGYPESGARLYSAVQGLLLEKQYALIDSTLVTRALEEVNLSPTQLLADPSSLKKFGERIMAKLLLTGTFLDFRIQKSYVSSKTFQVWDWDRLFYTDWILPTYHQGVCQIRLGLQMFDPGKDLMVWMAEGHGLGPAGSAVALERSLVQKLLEDLPSLPPSAPVK